MCAYKLVKVECNIKQRTLRSKVIEFVLDVLRTSYLKTHIQVYCWLDEWGPMELSVIRDYDQKATKIMNEKCKQAPAKKQGWKSNLFSKQPQQYKNSTQGTETRQRAKL